MPAVSSSPILTVVDDSDPLLGELAEVPPAPDGLLELLAQVADPRKPRGIRHGLTGVLAMALSAVITGAQSFVAIAEWAADASPEALARLGVTGTATSESTIRRCLQRLAPDQLDHLDRRVDVVAHQHDRRAAGDRLRRQDVTRSPRRGREPDAPAGRAVPAQSPMSTNRPRSGPRSHQSLVCSTGRVWSTAETSTTATDSMY